MPTRFSAAGTSTATRRRRPIRAVAWVKGVPPLYSAPTTRGTSGASVKMITRSPASKDVVPVREDRRPVADDRADQRAANGHVLEPLADVLARIAHRDVEHLVAVPFEHRHLLCPRVVREADDLLGCHASRVDRDVHASLLERGDRDRLVSDRDRERDAMHARQRCGVLVLRVVAHREDCSLGLADPLTHQEVGLESRRVVYARLRVRLRDAPGLCRRCLDHSDADPLLEEHPRDRGAHTPGAVHDDVCHGPARGPEERAPRLRSFRRADDDDPVAAHDRVTAAGKDRSPAPDDRGDLGVFRDGGVAQRNVDDLGGRVLVDVELADLNLPLGKHVRLAGRGHADDPRDRVCGLELGAHDEVDVELPRAPELDVLDVRSPDDRRRAARVPPREHAGDEIDLVS